MLLHTKFASRTLLYARGPRRGTETQRSVAIMLQDLLLPGICTRILSGCCLSSTSGRWPLWPHGMTLPWGNEPSERPGCGLLRSFPGLAGRHHGCPCPCQTTTCSVGPACPAVISHHRCTRTHVRARLAAVSSYSVFDAWASAMH